jgi:hypothetical protein
LLAVLLALCACKEKPTPPPLPPRDGRLGARRCSSLPGPKNKQLPILQRPFDNQYPVFYLFDHDVPGDVKPYDPAAKELAYCGLEMFGLLEGMDGYSWGLPANTPVLAAQEGVVTFAGKQSEYFCPIIGKMVDSELVVEVRHEGLGTVGYQTTYRSLNKVVVKSGEHVKAGQRLGLSGASGCVTEPLLFFVVHKLTGTRTGKPTVVDPYGWDYSAADPWEKEPTGSQSMYLWMPDEAPTLGGR